MKFDYTDLSDNILDAIYDMHFEDMTPIQEKCIPEILKGRDLLGVAQTGTGKTAAYLLPILSMLDEGDYPQSEINCVIMLPTRELAQQIDQAMEGFSYYLDNISGIAIYGGNDGARFEQETRSIKAGASVIIATPGRLLSHQKMGNLNLSHTSFFVLDEADRMLDMGFSEDIMAINKLLPETCQKIMFSATMPQKIRELAVSLLKDPVEISIAISKPAEKIHQSAYLCYEPQKLKIIENLAPTLKRSIIFCGKKERVKDINRSLKRLNINCDAMHSDLSQPERDDVMHRFKSGLIDVLVATDIVSRGIDIDDILTVINYDVPNDNEDYVHRIGRTARADRDGNAITFVNEKDMRRFHLIEKFIGKDIEKNALPEGIGEAPVYDYHGFDRQNRTDKGKHRHSRKRNNYKGKNRHNGNKKEATKKAPRKES